MHPAIPRICRISRISRVSGVAAAVAVLAIRAVVNAFLAPEPGTAWSNHLVAGAATLAVLGIVFAAFVVVPAGGQAAIALVLGVLALEGGLLALVSLASDGGLDDWVGLALLPVGAGLCILGACLLWRTRKAGRLRHLRRAGVLLLALVCAYWLVLPVGIAIVATHRPRHEVGAADLGRAYDAVRIRTADGLDLAAWYVPSRNGAAVVSYPTRSGKLPQARLLARHGYGVLLLDARGYDGSDGDPNAFGWSGARDIHAAVAWLRTRPEIRSGRIGGLGFSVGGEAMLDAAAENPLLGAVVSEGAGVRSYREELLYGIRGWPSLPRELVQTAAVALLSGSAPPPSLREVVARIAPRPVLLVYAEPGRGGEDLNPTYADASPSGTELWRVEAAGHTAAYDVAPREYERRVVGFFDRELLRG